MSDLRQAVARVLKERQGGRLRYTDNEDWWEALADMVLGVVHEHAEAEPLMEMDSIEIDEPIPDGWHVQLEAEASRLIAKQVGTRFVLSSEALGGSEKP